MVTLTSSPGFLSFPFNCPHPELGSSLSEVTASFRACVTSVHRASKEQRTFKGCRHNIRFLSKSNYLPSLENTDFMKQNLKASAYRHLPWWPILLFWHSGTYLLTPLVLSSGKVLTLLSFNFQEFQKKIFFSFSYREKNGTFSKSHQDTRYLLDIASFSPIVPWPSLL